MRCAFVWKLTGEKKYRDKGDKLLKAADKLSALIKCIEEKNSGNKEFLTAERETLKAIKKLDCPEADIFTGEFLGSYSMVLDSILK